jgi:hypothetical protein
MEVGEASTGRAYMKYFEPRQLAAGLFAFAVAAASLLPEPARAADLMFRMEQKFYGASGLVTIGVRPREASPACGDTGAACGPASVGTTSPAAKFVLPKSFLNTYYTYTYTGYTGYYSKSTISSYNGVGRFGPNNPNAVTPSLPTGTPTYGRVFFPTLGGTMTPTPNKAPHKAQGPPAVPTTTFSGDFDFSRAGSIQITPSRGPSEASRARRRRARLAPVNSSRHPVRSRRAAWCRATS